LFTGKIEKFLPCNSTNNSLSLFFLYIKDVPESGLKPPPLGKLARQLRPTVGVFQPVSIGSRDPL